MISSYTPVVKVIIISINPAIQQLLKSSIAVPKIINSYAFARNRIPTVTFNIPIVANEHQKITTLLLFSITKRGDFELFTQANNHTCAGTNHTKV